MTMRATCYARRPRCSTRWCRHERGGAGAAAYPVVLVFHPRREARRAVQLGYPRGAGSVRLCRTIQAVQRLLDQRLVDAVVLDVRNCDGVGLTLPARFPRIPMYALCAVRPDDRAEERRVGKECRSRWSPYH